jgi:hypothetical protein
MPPRHSGTSAANPRPRTDTASGILTAVKARRAGWAATRTPAPARRSDGWHQRVIGLEPTYFESSCVYCLVEKDGPLVAKLGQSRGHPRERLASLQTGNFRQLLLLGYTFHLTEKAVHRRWRNLKVAGEWFRLNAGLLYELRSWDWLNAVLFSQVAQRLGVRLG